MKKKKFIPKHNKHDKNEEINENDLDFMINPGDENASDPFLNSLDKLSEKDIDDGDAPPKAKKKKKGSLVTNIILVISCAVFVGCGIYLAINLMDKKENTEMYEDLAAEYMDGISFENAVDQNKTEDKDDTGAVRRLSKISSANPVLCLSDRIALGSNVVTGNYDEQLQQMRASLTALSEQNSDTYGWIQIPDTQINHPIVQAKDNDHYLNYAYTGGYSVLGSIFADYRNNRDIYRNFNTVLYGHNITSGGMFHDVENMYKNEELFRNSLIYVYTMKGVYVYQPFSVHEARSDYNYFRTEFATTDEFIKFAEEMRSNSVHPTEMEFVRTDRIITLSTCTNGAPTQRYALHAKLVQVIN